MVRVWLQLVMVVNSKQNFNSLQLCHYDIYSLAIFTNKEQCIRSAAQATLRPLSSLRLHDLVLSTATVPHHKAITLSEVSRLTRPPS
jgi:hypothetical protein